MSKRTMVVTGDEVKPYANGGGITEIRRLGPKVIDDLTKVHYRIYFDDTHKGGIWWTHGE